MSLYRFIDSQKADYTIGMLCRVAVVPESSYYEWNRTGRRVAERRAQARVVLLAQITAVHEASDRTYGSERVWAQLRRDGVIVAERTVAALMAEAGIVGVTGRERSTVTTRRDLVLRLAVRLLAILGL